MKKKGVEGRKTKKRTFFYILLRYGILLVLGMSFPFYKVFSPLTIWPSYFLLNLFYEASLKGRVLFFAAGNIEIIDACVAGSAYFLLLILNLSTPMRLKQRVYSLLFSCCSLLILNIIRIFILSVMFLNNFPFFSLVHKLFWYVLSIVFVVGIWFLTVWLFKIKAVPGYSDVRKIRSCKATSAP